ncbi:MAG: phosphopantothenoylcysteine decarboxylase [Rubrobacter sp.]|nr:phosphopantothenoylcysteine decarboxylase [Rubrobacter sp.]
MGAGTAALSAPEVCRELSERGHRLEVVLERGARHFVGPAAFSGHATVVEEPTGTPEATLFCPATAGTLARLARGLGGGSAALVLSGKRSVVVLPQLDSGTAVHPAVQGNLELLRGDGCRVLGNYAGDETSLLGVASAVLRELGGPMSGQRVVVTAGGTREPIDSVRFVGNRSSGKMGAAVAREAVRRGAEVSVVAANVQGVEPGVRWVAVETVEELRRETLKLCGAADVLVMAAAVSDFAPAGAVSEKIRRGSRDRIALELTATADVLQEVREACPGLFVVGFAATHGDPVADSREKLRKKGVDLMVGNDISRPGVGFGAEENEVYLVGAGGFGERFVPRGPKSEVASVILDALMLELDKKREVAAHGRKNRSELHD